eukprot:jgi/Mesvir1/22498/Mv18531-RA.3
MQADKLKFRVSIKGRDDRALRLVVAPGSTIHSVKYGLQKCWEQTFDERLIVQVLFDEEGVALPPEATIDDVLRSGEKISFIPGSPSQDVAGLLNQHVEGGGKPSGERQYMEESAEELAISLLLGNGEGPVPIAAVATTWLRVSASCLSHISTMLTSGAGHPAEVARDSGTLAMVNALAGLAAVLPARVPAAPRGGSPSMQVHAADAPQHQPPRDAPAMSLPPPVSTAHAPVATLTRSLSPAQPSQPAIVPSSKPAAVPPPEPPTVLRQEVPATRQPSPPRATARLAPEDPVPVLLARVLCHVVGVRASIKPPVSCATLARPLVRLLVSCVAPSQGPEDGGGLALVGASIRQGAAGVDPSLYRSEWMVGQADRPRGGNAGTVTTLQGGPRLGAGGGGTSGNAGGAPELSNRRSGEWPAVGAMPASQPGSASGQQHLSGGRHAAGAPWVAPSLPEPALVAVLLALCQLLDARPNSGTLPADPAQESLAADNAHAAGATPGSVLPPPPLSKWSSSAEAQPQQPVRPTLTLRQELARCGITPVLAQLLLPPTTAHGSGGNGAPSAARGEAEGGQASLGAGVAVTSRVFLAAAKLCTTMAVEADVAKLLLDAGLNDVLMRWLASPPMAARGSTHTTVEATGGAPRGAGSSAVVFSNAALTGPAGNGNVAIFSNGNVHQHSHPAGLDHGLGSTSYDSLRHTAVNLLATLHGACTKDGGALGPVCALTGATRTGFSVNTATLLAMVREASTGGGKESLQLLAAQLLAEDVARLCAGSGSKSKGPFDSASLGMALQGSATVTGLLRQDGRLDALWTLARLPSKEVQITVARTICMLATQGHDDKGQIADGVGLVMVGGIATPQC